MRRFGAAIIVVLVLAVVASLAILQPFSGAKADTGSAGYDLLETGSPTHLEFGGASSIDPIAADFFGPGSDPFEGQVALQGDPFDDFDPGTGTISGLSPTDTIIERQEDAGPAFPDTIDIEIVALNLVSTAPITVTYFGGLFSDQWDVQIEVPASGAQATGTMTISHEHANGGTFDSTLPVKPVVTFTNVSNPAEVREMDWTVAGLDAIDLSATGVPWCHTANPLDTPAGIWVIEKEGLTSNFFPGIDCSTAVGDDLVRDSDYFTLSDGASDHVVRAAQLLETNYKCYDFRYADDPLGIPVTLETQFGVDAVDAGVATYLCPPAVKNGMGDEFAPHLKCYDILGTDPDVIVDLETQFGLEEDVAVGQGRLMCVPAVKTPLEPQGPSSGPLVPSPHYECFEIAGLPPTPDIFVDLLTQFGIEEDVHVNGPQYLCAPAIKYWTEGPPEGEGDLDAPHLKCYDIFNATAPPVDWLVELVTQFGTEYKWVDEAQMLCIPVAKTIVPEATPTPTPTPTATPTPTPTATPTPTPAPPPPVHYQWYDIFNPAGGADPPVAVDVETQFGTQLDVPVGPARSLLAPARKNTEPPPDLYGMHLECYEYQSTWDPDYVVKLTNQFHTLTDVAVGPATELCAPTHKVVGTGDPGPPPPEPHYVCYDIFRTAYPPGVNVETQFQSNYQTLDDYAVRLCAPAIKNGVGNLDLPHLTCYDIVSGYDPVEFVSLHTQFGLETNVPVNLAQLFCVPTDKTVVSGPTPTPTPTPTPGPGDCPDPSSVPWPVPVGDADCDGFSTVNEGTIGTDPADNCPDNTTDDAWPCDFDMNTVINITDVFNVLPPVFGSSPLIPDTNGDGIIDWSIRRDLWPDGVINITDVFLVLPPFFGSSCTP